MYPLFLAREMNHAMDRCNEVADSERLLGFADSAEMYKDMAQEFSGLALWVLQYAVECGFTENDNAA